MDTKPEKYVRKLIEVSNRKYKLLLGMLNMTEKMAKALEEENLDDLDNFINEKQKIISEIDKSDKEFEVYFKRLKFELGVEKLEDLKNPQVDGIKELKEIVSKIMNLITKISELDKKNTERAEKSLNDLGNEIKKLNQGKKMFFAYNLISANPSSIFFDKKK